MGALGRGGVGEESGRRVDGALLGDSEMGRGGAVGRWGRRPKPHLAEEERAR